MSNQIDASLLLTDTETHHVQYEWILDPADPAMLTLERTVWLKAYRRKDRRMVDEQIVARISANRAPDMVRDLMIVAADATKGA